MISMHVLNIVAAYLLGEKLWVAMNESESTHLRSSFSMSRKNSRLSPREAARLKLTLNALQFCTHSKVRTTQPMEGVLTSKDLLWRRSPQFCSELVVSIKRYRKHDHLQWSRDAQMSLKKT